jgi:hypothetical protein
MPVDNKNVCEINIYISLTGEIVFADEGSYFL